MRACKERERESTHTHMHAQIQTYVCMHTCMHARIQMARALDGRPTPEALSPEPRRDADVASGNAVID